MAEEPKEGSSDAFGGDEKAAMESAGPDGERPGEAALTIPGMGSNHCAGIVSESIRRLSGIAEINTNISAHRAVVRFDPTATGLDEIRRAVEKTGYAVTASREKGKKTGPEQAEAEEETEERFLREAHRRIWIAAIPTILIMVLMAVHMLWTPVPGYLAIIAVLGFPAVFIAGASTHKSAWRSVVNRTANMGAGPGGTQRISI